MSEMGFYMTPNKMIPLNDREPGEIAEVAKDQLAAYQAVAVVWSMYTDYDSDNRSKVQRPVRCGNCHQALWFRRDRNGVDLTYTDDETLALTVAHIRQRHPEVKQ